MSAAEVIRAALELSLAEREEVAQTLLESLEGGVDQAEVDAAWRAEVSNRVEEIRSGQVQGLSRDEVKALLHERRAARSM
jgi:putative addiction module component (TIGR02574 family)